MNKVRPKRITRANKKYRPAAACEESYVLKIYWKKSKHLCYNF